jgi:hypothetical protein
MNSHLTAIVAEQQRSDMHKAAARSRRAGSVSRPERAERPRRRRWLRLRDRPAVA